MSRRVYASLFAAIATVVTFAVASLWHSGPAGAAPYPPSQSCTLSSSDTNVQGGDTLTVTGSGFAGNATVNLSIQPNNAASLGSVRTDGHGSFVDTVTIPASITGSDHLIVANSASTTCSFDPFGGAAVAGVSVHRGAHTGGLASTGFAALSASVIALVLVGGGVALLLLGRRRRSSN